jgi:hypothetical protein
VQILAGDVTSASSGNDMDLAELDA